MRTDFVGYADPSCPQAPLDPPIGGLEERDQWQREMDARSAGVRRRGTASSNVLRMAAGERTREELDW